MNNTIYLDNSATTKPSHRVLSEMLPFLTDHFGISQAPHYLGQSLHTPIKTALKKIYSLLNATESDQFVFTSSSAEAVNQVFLSTYLEVSRKKGKNHFISSTIEEAPSLMCMNRLAQLGCNTTFVSPNENGIILPSTIIEAMTPRTVMVSLSYANGLTGVIQPIREIAKVCQERGAFLHLEMSHVLGKVYFDLEEINPDFITFSGNLFHAPQGTGGLYIKEKSPIVPLIMGGLEQNSLRGGPINVASLVALGYAAFEALDSRDLICTETSRLKNLLEEGIKKAYPEAIVLFEKEERLPHVTTICFPGISNEALLYLLSKKQLYASMGGGNFQQISYLLKAHQLPNTLANSAIHFSLSRETTEDEIERAIFIITECAKHLKKTSSYLKVP